MFNTIKPGDRFRHFKTGVYYKIISIFTWEPTKEQSVEYESEKTGERWGRTLKAFLEEVSHNDQIVPRFKKVKDSSEDSLLLYGLEEKYDENGQPYWIVVHWGGDGVATLKGGYSAVLVLSFINMANQNPQRGSDYMAGVIAGCTHMQLLGPTGSTNNSPTASNPNSLPTPSASP